jgi:hypothetical protein
MLHLSHEVNIYVRNVDNLVQVSILKLAPFFRVIYTFVVGEHDFISQRTDNFFGLCRLYFSSASVFIFVIHIVDP